MNRFGSYQRGNSLRGVGEKLLALVLEAAPREQLGAWLRVPLEHAAAKGDWDFVKILLVAGADAVVRRHAVLDRSPLVAAAHGGNGTIVAALLENGSAPDGEERETSVYLDDDTNVIITGSSASVVSDTQSHSSAGIGRRTPLHFAASGGHLAAVRALLSAGADTDVEDEDGCSALHLAVFRGYEEVVQELVSAGANVDTSDSEGETPLHTACSHGNLAMVRAILRGSHDRKFYETENGGIHLEMSPLHRAALGGHCDVMQELLDCGSSLRSLAGNARTSLHAAAMSGSADAVRFLLGLDFSSLEAKDQEGRTALHIASGHRLGSDGTLMALLMAGANTETRTVLGETALHKACKALRVSAVKMLLRWGASEEAVAADGRTPAVMALQLLESQCPGMFRDMLKAILRMLANAPADRVWRRRGWLLMLRSRRQNSDQSLDGNSSRHSNQHRSPAPFSPLTGWVSVERGGCRRPWKMAKEETVLVLPTHESTAAQVENHDPGETAVVVDTSGFEEHGERLSCEDRGNNGTMTNLRAAVDRATGVEEDDIFRGIVAFL